MARIFTNVMLASNPFLRQRHHAFVLNFVNLYRWKFFNLYVLTNVMFKIYLVICFVSRINECFVDMQY